MSSAACKHGGRSSYSVALQVMTVSSYHLARSAVAARRLISEDRGRVGLTVGHPASPSLHPYPTRGHQARHAHCLGRLWVRQVGTQWWWLNRACQPPSVASCPNHCRCVAGRLEAFVVCGGGTGPVEIGRRRAEPPVGRCRCLLTGSARQRGEQMISRSLLSVRREDFR